MILHMSKHFITDIDLEIIKNLYNLKNNQTITTYSLAKKMFDDRDIKNKNRFIYLLIFKWDYAKNPYYKEFYS